jgi:Zn finger protein HypA/HybF involved in hydrogenase expression
MNYEKLKEENFNCDHCIAISILLDEGESHICPQCKREHVKASVSKEDAQT